MVKKLWLYGLMAVIQKFILVNNKTRVEKTSNCTQFPEFQALLPHSRVSFAVTRHFLGSCVLRVGEQGGQGMQEKTQGTGMKRPHSDGESARPPCQRRELYSLFS